MVQVIQVALAQRIVREISEATGHNINFFGIDGVCIASTDAQRIGHFHEAAFLAARDRKTVSVRNNHEFQGARSGINIPVSIDGEIAAVVGISGNSRDVAPFGHVLIKMTEILVRESRQQERYFDRRLSMAHLMDSLCNADFVDATRSGAVSWSGVFPADIQAQADSLGVDLNQAYSCMVVLGVPDRQLGADAGSSRFYFVESVLSRLFPAYFLTLNHDRLTVFVPTAYLETEKAQEFLRELSAHFSQDLHCGVSQVPDMSADAVDIGSTVASQFSSLYTQTLTTAQWARMQGLAEPCFFQAEPIACLLESTSADTQRSFAHQVLGSLTPTQLDTARETFQAFVRANGSISHIASALGVHKNTVQNRLNRVARWTGFNPREVGDCAVLFVAFVFRDFVEAD
ncbi:CdaR family transcriptional regulator [Alloscardovia criceti]|uniref:CdaR family transcriptional regulator n=1 Tax=Alloscardovia criceti TaxID=356828 RepID=UPI00037F7AD7|nr:sugar diacid recognition domain-containing protein [Alloscardovia criceti]